MLDSRRCAPQAPILGYVGEDADGSRWGWITGEEPSSTDISPPSARLLSIPSSLTLDQAQAALSCWPAWRLSVLGGVGLGTRVLVSGSDWLARSVLKVTRLRGRSWGAIHAPSSDERVDAEYQLSSGTALNEALGRLPERPDVVILTHGPSSTLAQAVTLCRTGGSVVVAGDGWQATDFGFYPEVHRRGLRLVFTTIAGAHSSLPDASHDFASLSRLLSSAPNGAEPR